MQNSRDALRSLAAVEPSDLAALQSLPPDVLDVLLRDVRLTARGSVRADEVESLAAVIVGRLYRGDTLAAARAAVALARRTVGQAYAGVDSLDAWAEVAPDMIETRGTGTAPDGLPHGWAPRPDAAYATTTRDLIAAAVESVPDGDARRILRDASRAYLAHGERRCSVCESASGMGRAVSLTGILAHTRRLTGTDSEYHALRRLIVAALRTVDRAGVLREYVYPYAEGGRPSSVAVEWADRLTAPTGDGLPRTDLVRVTHADGTRTTHTQAHYDGMRADRSDDDRRADRIAEGIAAAPSRAVRRQERTRGNGGTGAYGSQVPARLSR